MAFTYGNAPSSDTATGRRDAVRLLIGDADDTDFRVTDEEIAFYLSETSDDVYAASIVACRALAARYAGLGDTSIDGVTIRYSEIAKNYTALATRLEKQAKESGSLKSAGIPQFGGTSESDMRSADEDTDRVKPYVRHRQFTNPPRFDEIAQDYDGY